MPDAITRSWLTALSEFRRCCAQHPDLVEKRRKAFGDNLRTYLITAQAGDKGGLDNGSTRPGVNGVIREDGPEEPESAGAGDGDGSGRHSDSYNLRRRGTAPA